MASNEINMSCDLAQAKKVANIVLEKQNFKVTYSGATEAVAERGSGLATMFAGPLAGKKNIAVKLGLSFQDTGDGTALYISDATSGLQKTLTLTGGSAKKVMEEVIKEIRDGLDMAGVLR